MSPALTAPVYRTIKLTDENKRTVTYKVCVAEEGLYIALGGEKAKGPVSWSQAYGLCCFADAAKAKAKR